MGVVFSGFGQYIPEKRIGNEALAAQFGISSVWIEERTGILERRYAAVHEQVSDMCVAAAEAAIANSGLDKHSIDCIIVATITPDYGCPSTAAIVQDKLGINNCFAFDIAAACSGFIYALNLADSLISSDKHTHVLVIGGDKMSKMIDQHDRKAALILADGAGACIVSKHSEKKEIISAVCKLDSALCKSVITDEEGYLRFTDKKVFHGGIALFEKVIRELLTKEGLGLEAIDLMVPHQANKRMLEELARQMQIPIEKIYINVGNIGNTSAATIPIALSMAKEEGCLKGKILFASVGAGFTYGAMLLEV